MTYKKGDLVEVRRILGVGDGFHPRRRGIVLQTTAAISDNDPKGVLVMINDGVEASEWYAWQLEMISEK